MKILMIVMLLSLFGCAYGTMEFDDAGTVNKDAGGVDACLHHCGGGR